MKVGELLDSIKVGEAVEAKPTAKELAHRETLSHGTYYGPIGADQVYVAKNQKDAFIANIMARIHEMDINPKHVEVNWSSPRHATIFPDANIRFVVVNRKSELYKGTEIAEIFPIVAKGLVKNAFRDVFGFKVKVEQEEQAPGEYANGIRYLDYNVTWEQTGPTSSQKDQENEAQ